MAYPSQLQLLTCMHVSHLTSSHLLCTLLSLVMWQGPEAILHLAGSCGVLSAARFPAARRPQQLHNVALALEAMQTAGLSLKVQHTQHSQLHPTHCVCLESHLCTLYMQPA